jgi:hypothetical protein
LENDPAVQLAADAIICGMDPAGIIDRGKEDYLINLAILKKVSKNRAEEKVEEIQTLSKLIAAELAAILGAILG